MESIGRGAFHINELESIELNDSLETIGDGAFTWNNLKQVLISKNTKYIKSNTSQIRSSFESDVRIVYK